MDGFKDLKATCTLNTELVMTSVLSCCVGVHHLKSPTMHIVFLINC